MANDSLSLEEARRVALRAQGLFGARVTAGGVPAMVRRLGAVQLDTISVLARSHELVAYARQGPIGSRRVEEAYWGPKSDTFEYWSHAACVVPLEDWPAYEFKRRAQARPGQALARPRGCRQVVWRGAGPAARRGTADRQRAGRGQEGRALVGLVRDEDRGRVVVDVGELVCRQRRGFQRVYDLTERAVPDDLLAQEWTDDECAHRLVSAAGRSLGVATEADLAVYHGLPRPLVRRALPATDLVRVVVAGWAQPTYADPAALAPLGAALGAAACSCHPSTP